MTEVGALEPVEPLNVEMRKRKVAFGKCHSNVHGQVENHIKYALSLINKMH